MKTLDEKLNILKQNIAKKKVRIMIMGLGSVGNYLMDYLMSTADDGIEIFVVGRNYEKMLSDVNIVKVASLIRNQNRTSIHIISGIDFNNVPAIAKCLKDNKPDIIVNSSRAYSGLKYGSISWKNVRAYGIWAPLAIKYIKNIMAAYEDADSNAIVINTSYSDAVIPWLKSAGKAYPDFGSGNFRHLLPRMQLAIAEKYNIEDYWNIDITFVAAHFHDVVLSKEGQTEGVEPLINISYQGKKLEPDMEGIYAKCNILTPVDQKRNMMNASSNFEIIESIISSVRDGKKFKLHCPGVFGEIGGYPVIIDGTSTPVKAYIDQSKFSIEDMRKKNRDSIYLDGIENVQDGTLTYTDELIAKCKRVFNVVLPKQVPFEKIEETANLLIEDVIKKNI